jgi:hypothetical protein
VQKFKINVWPSPLEELRERYHLSGAQAAERLGLTEKQLEFLEAHTLVFPPTVWAPIHLALAPENVRRSLGLADVIEPLFYPEQPSKDGGQA